ncbi:MAG: hypothetical protein E7436_04405 [Ruminococcaceae bacterium]|nr:hypothetical protein [Oscillospiraceae bacterium]
MEQHDKLKFEMPAGASRRPTVVWRNMAIHPPFYPFVAFLIKKRPGLGRFSLNIFAIFWK